METNPENKATEGRQDYDEAIRMGQEIEKEVADTGTWVSPINLELLLANAVIACFYPAVWGAIALFFTAGCISAANRNTVRKCLKAHDIAGAKAALGPAKTWHTIATLTIVAMAFIEIWGFFRLVDYIKGQ